MHPETRLRITPGVKKSSVETTPETTPSFDYSTEYDEETTLPTNLVESSTILDLETTYESLEELEKTTEFIFSPTVVSTTLDTVTTPSDENTTPFFSEVHETADKHSTFSPVEENLAIAIEEPEGVNEIIFIEPLELDIQNEIVDQVVEESQDVHTAWSDAEITPEPAVPGRLTNYEKDIDTSKYGQDYTYSAKDLSPSYNEHGQQGVETQDSDLEGVVETEKIESWKPSVIPFRPYTEIDRSAGIPVPSVEEVEISESKDYSEPDILYDDSKVGFSDEIHKKYYSVPVFAQLNLPETSTREELTTQSETTTTPLATAFVTSTTVSQTTTLLTTTEGPVYAEEATTVFVPVSSDETTLEPENETTMTDVTTSQNIQVHFLNNHRYDNKDTYTNDKDMLSLVNYLYSKMNIFYHS